VQIEKDVNNNKYSLTIPKANPSVHAGAVVIKATNPIATITHELTLNIRGNYSLLLILKYKELVLNLNLN
jgi:hypothetical protein